MARRSLPRRGHARSGSGERRDADESWSQGRCGDGSVQPVILVRRTETGRRACGRVGRISRPVQVCDPHLTRCARRICAGRIKFAVVLPVVRADGSCQPDTRSAPRHRCQVPREIVAFLAVLGLGLTGPDAGAGSLHYFSGAVARGDDHVVFVDGCHCAAREDGLSIHVHRLRFAA